MSRSNTYDANDQQAGGLYPNGSRVTLVYDAVGQPTIMEDSTGRYTTPYDLLGRKASVIVVSKDTYSCDCPATKVR